MSQNFTAHQVHSLCASQIPSETHLYSKPFVIKYGDSLENLNARQTLMNCNLKEMLPSRALVRPDLAFGTREMA